MREVRGWMDEMRKKIKGRKRGSDFNGENN